LGSFPSLDVASIGFRNCFHFPPIGPCRGVLLFSCIFTNTWCRLITEPTIRFGCFVKVIMSVNRRQLNAVCTEPSFVVNLPFKYLAVDAASRVPNQQQDLSSFRRGKTVKA